MGEQAEGFDVEQEAGRRSCRPERRIALRRRRIMGGVDLDNGKLAGVMGEPIGGGPRGPRIEGAGFDQRAVGPATSAKQNRCCRPACPAGTAEARQRAKASCGAGSLLGRPSRRGASTRDNCRTTILSRQRRQPDQRHDHRRQTQCDHLRGVLQFAELSHFRLHASYQPMAPDRSNMVSSHWPVSASFPRM